VVGATRILAARDLHDIKSKLGLQVRRWVLDIRHQVAKSLAQLGILNWNRPVHRERMASVVGCIVREGPQRKRVLRHVGRRTSASTKSALRT
jgi:hypothetical protein